MLTHRIDAALWAIEICRLRAPALLDCYRPATPEREAIEGLLAALEVVDATLGAEYGPPLPRPLQASH